MKSTKLYHFALLLFSVSTYVSAKDYSSCYLAYGLSYKHQYEESIEQAAVCLGEKNLPCDERRAVLMARAWSYFNLGNYTEAVSDQYVVISIGDPTSDDYRNLTLYLLKAGRLEERLDAAIEANRIERENGGPSMPTQYHLGWAYYDNGKYNQAIEALTTGIPLQPDFPFAYYRRALAFEMLGGTESAKNDLHIVATLLQQGGWENTPIDIMEEVEAAFERFGIDRPSKLLQPASKDSG